MNSTSKKTRGLAPSLLCILLAHCSTPGGKSLNSTPTSQLSSEERLALPQAALLEKRRWHAAAPLSPAARAVVGAAFDGDYPEAENKANAYTFHLYGATKSMVGWNFPWDLPSPAGDRTYTLQREDMAGLLNLVMVREETSSLVWVSYANMLRRLTASLTMASLNGQGDGHQALEIIYCVRNFLRVAQQIKRPEDVVALQIAAQKLLDLNNSGYLHPNSLSITATNLEGQEESRSLSQGLQELQQLIQ